jgi:hypothetical protein
MSRKKLEVNMYISIIALLLSILAWFPIMAIKADERRFVKSRLTPSRLEMQRRITRGKASLR